MRNNGRDAKGLNGHGMAKNITINAIPNQNRTVLCLSIASVFLLALAAPIVNSTTDTIIILMWYRLKKVMSAYLKPSCVFLKKNLMSGLFIYRVIPINSCTCDRPDVTERMILLSLVYGLPLTTPSMALAILYSRANNTSQRINE